MKPNVSIVITCYNHGHYLAMAIESCMRQITAAKEIIVIDDGSTDNTRSVTLQYPSVNYVFQSNMGLSAARNCGIDNACGEFIIFLDADDWLYPTAVDDQLRAFQIRPESMAVAGDHRKVSEDGKTSFGGRAISKAVEPYLHLLELNFIGMHAAVMFRKKFFEEYRYDTSLKAAEDYDLLLRLTRKYPLYVHHCIIAAYRQHGENMSRNIPLMLEMVLAALQRQEPDLQNEAEKAAFQSGINFWNQYYAEKLLEQKLSQCQDGQLALMLTPGEETILRRQIPGAVEKIIKLTKSKSIRRRIKNLIPKKNAAANSFPLKLINIFRGRNESAVAQVGRINWGSLYRTVPFDPNFGYGRGLPIDRYYIENFLKLNSLDIGGRVLEIGDNSYTLRFGDKRILQSDVLHVLPNYPGATYVGDLSRADEIPIADNTYDCILLTQTLHLIYDYQSAIAHCWRILKPGGVLLLTSPGISSIDRGEWSENWLWSFNRQSLARIMAESFSQGYISIQGFGNVFAATAFLWGASVEEIGDKSMLDQYDEAYPVTLAVRAVKK